MQAQSQLVKDNVKEVSKILNLDELRIGEDVTLMEITHNGKLLVSPNERFRNLSDEAKVAVIEAGDTVEVKPVQVSDVRSEVEENDARVRRLRDDGASRNLD